MKSSLLAAILCLSLGLSAQNITVTGRVVDNSGSPLPGASVYLTVGENAVDKLGAVANTNGYFTITGVSARVYTLQATFIGFTTYTKTITVPVTGLNTGTIKLKESSVKLGEVTATARETRATQVNDTMRYNADAFKTIQGSNIESLVSKMPGIVVDNSGVQAQGEKVQQVLVDGKPFFDGDPTLALRNLPADIVQNIEVFDKKSDQAEFTGFDDGNSIKTMNVVTRRGMQTGIFGKLTGGAGMDKQKDVDYQASASLNIFNGNRRITLLGMSNNINIQNFSQEDLAGVMGGGGRGSRGGGGGAGNFVAGGQGGLTKTNAGGFNYTDKWGSKIDVTGGYFFNMTNNTTNQTITDTYIPDSLGRIRLSNVNSFRHSINYNHRFNLRLTYNLDANNSFIFTPSVSFQRNENDNSSQSYIWQVTSKLDSSNIVNNTTTTASNLSLGALYRHRFSKLGRTLSAQFNIGSNTNNGDGTNVTTGSIQARTPNRIINNNSGGYNYGGNITYTEPIGSNSILLASYRISNNNRDINRYVYDANTHLRDDSLSNVYNSSYLTQQAGLGYRFRSQSGLMLSAGFDLQHASLTGDQTYPHNGHTDFSFYSFLPNVMLNYKINTTNALRFFFRTSTSAPSVQQLQNVIDNSNPIYITGGNPDLAQQTTSRILFRYSYTPTSGQTFIFMLSGGNTINYIGNNVFDNNSKDTVYLRGAQVVPGAQFSYPVNLQGNWNFNSLITYGFPVDFLKSNLNLSGSFGYNRLPSIYNNTRQVTNNYTVTPKIILGSNISDKLDFTLTYASSFNIAKSSSSATANTATNNTYLNQLASLKFDWIFWKGFTTQILFTYQNNSGLSEGYNQNYFLWNMSIGKKILKNDRGEIKLQAYDILHQNRSLTHSVYDRYYEDVQTNVMQPYYMLTFTYDLRNFKGTQQMQQQQRQRRQWDGGGRDGMPMPPGDRGGMPPEGPPPDR